MSKEVPSRKTIEESQLETLRGFREYDLIAEEVMHARRLLLEIGISEQELELYLVGSAARNELRTIETYPEDPSDIDILALVSEFDISLLDRLMNEGAHLGRTQTPVATSFSVKRSSISGRLNPTEIFVYSRVGLEAELNGSPLSQRTRFVNQILIDAVRV
jgi:hypothetical protein